MSPFILPRSWFDLWSGIMLCMNFLSFIQILQFRRINLTLENFKIQRAHNEQTRLTKLTRNEKMKFDEKKKRCLCRRIWFTPALNLRTAPLRPREWISWCIKTIRHLKSSVQVIYTFALIFNTHVNSEFTVVSFKERKKERKGLLPRKRFFISYMTCVLLKIYL